MPVCKGGIPRQFPLPDRASGALATDRAPLRGAHLPGFFDPDYRHSVPLGRIEISRSTGLQTWGSGTFRPASLAGKLSISAGPHTYGLGTFRTAGTAWWLLIGGIFDLRATDIPSLRDGLELSFSKLLGIGGYREFVPPGRLGSTSFPGSAHLGLHIFRPPGTAWFDLLRGVLAFLGCRYCVQPCGLGSSFSRIPGLRNAGITSLRDGSSRSSYRSLRAAVR